MMLIYYDLSYLIWLWDVVRISVIAAGSVTVVCTLMPLLLQRLK
jgi:hypothetical protein